MCSERYQINIFGDQHSTARDIPDKFKKFWIFGFIRNPIMAEVSDWRYHRRYWESNESFTFENWCRWRFEESADFGKQFGLNDADMYWGRVWNTRPQAGFFCDENGECVADAIFRYEELEESLKIISDTIGVDLSLPDKPLPSPDGYVTETMTYAWSRGREDYTQYVTDEAERILRKAKSIDFMIHGWPGPVLTKYTCPTVQNYAYTR